MQFLYFLLGLSIHFLIELYGEWRVDKKITWTIHFFPAGISVATGVVWAIFAAKLNLQGTILYAASAVLGFLTNYLLQKLFKWNTPKTS